MQGDAGVRLNRRLLDDSRPEAESLGRFDEVGERVGLHLLHHATPPCGNIENSLCTNVSEGRNVEVEITYDPRQFRLRVRDDGRGIDWGQRGMRERAQRIGAQLNLWSRSETGTEVELTVPGATAYQVPGAKPKWFRSRRPNGAD